MVRSRSRRAQGSGTRNMQRHSVLIVGGGIAGLTAAIALRQQGHDVEVAERDPAWSVYGVGIIQQGNVLRAMAALGLLDSYVAAGFAFDSVTMFAPDGSKIAEIPSYRLAGAQYPANLGIARTAVHRLLGDRAIEVGAKIRLGVTFARMHDDGAGVHVTFTDATEGRYDFVIGADGVHSQTRRWLFPHAAAPRLTGQSVWRYNLPRPPEVTSLHAYAGRTGAGLVPLSATLMYLFVTTEEPGDRRMPSEGIAAAMRARIAHLPRAIAALAEAITDDAAVVFRPLECVLLEGDWFAGRVIVIGDAAHATTPHLGQGSGMAIEDSLVLAEEVSRNGDLGHAFRAFMDRRAERCRFIVENSVAVGDYQMGRLAHLDYAAVTQRMHDVTAAPI